MGMRMRRPLDRLPLGVILAIAVLAVPPLLVWQAHPRTVGYPGAIAAVVGIVLTAVVFMLSAAQNAYQKALDAVVSEFAERDAQVCKAGAGDDPEPWPVQMDRELQHVETVAAMAALLPGERRWRRRSKRRQETALGSAESIWFAAAEHISAEHISAALSATGAAEQSGKEQCRNEQSDTGPSEETIENWVKTGLTPGQENFLPIEVRNSWNWKKESRDYQNHRQSVKDLENEYNKILKSALSRAGLRAHPFWQQRTLSPLAVQFEDVLGAQLRPLEAAYVLTAAMLSLTATGMVYGRDALLWPFAPAALAAITVVAVATVYIGIVRRSMISGGYATARRLNRLTLPALRDADILLSDAFVASVVKYRDPVQEKFWQVFTCLSGMTDLPLRHRLLGEYHLVRAWKALRVHRPPPQMGHFTSLATGKPADARAVIRELDVACRHLERAVAQRNDDPVAALALAGALDAMAAATGKPPKPELSERAAEAFIAATGPELADKTWKAQLRANRWLWPREHGTLAELAKPYDALRST